MLAKNKIERGELRTLQIEDLSALMKKPRVPILHDPGCGKTPPVCTYIYYLWSELGVKTFWPQPRSLFEKNKRELVKFSEFEPDDIYIFGSKSPIGDPFGVFLLKLWQGVKVFLSKRDKEMLQEAITKGLVYKTSRNPTPLGNKYIEDLKVDPAFEKAKVIICGFSRFSNDWLAMYSYHHEMDHVAVDEMHLGYSTHESQRTQNFYVAMRNFKYFTPMTGTILRGRLSSAYPIIHIVEPRHYISIDDFMSTHALYDDYGKVVGWQNHEKLKKILDKHSIRRSFKEVHGDEKPVIQTEEVEMGPKQRKAYDKFEAEAILELENYFLTGEDPGVATIRLRQIMAHPETFGLANGELTGKDERLQVHLDNHMEGQEPLVVFAALVPEQERILNMALKTGLRVELINGAVDLKQRDRIDRAFQAGELDGVVGSAQTMGVGFNWGHCDHFIFPSLDYQDDNFAQGYKRGIRGKRETPLWVSVFEYRKSIDQMIMAIVERKSRESNRVDNTYDIIRFRN